METITKLATRKAQTGFLTEGRQNLTPAQANWIFQNLRYEFNRNENHARRHISGLARMMREGDWTQGRTIEFARQPDGTLTLVDGHHRMLAQVEAGVDIEWTILIHDVDDAAAVRDLFWTYDTQVRIRNLSTILSAVNAAENLGVKREVALSVSKAAQFIAGGMRAHVGAGGAFFTPAEKVRLVEEWRTEAQLYDQCLDASPRTMKRKLRSSQVTAGALVTFRTDSEAAWRFWMELCRDDGLRKGDPRKTLLDWIRDTHLSGSGLTATTAAVARAWNAFIENKQLNLIRIGKQPVTFAGGKYRVAP